MGISIDVHVYDYEQLVNDIREKAEGVEIPEGRSVEFFVQNILPEFGLVCGDKFVTLWNDYYEYYNSGAELMNAVELYFGVKDSFLGKYHILPHTNAQEVLDSLGFEPLGDDEG